MNETKLIIERGCVKITLNMRMEPPNEKIIKRFIDCSNSIYGEELDGEEVDYE